MAEATSLTFSTFLNNSANEINKTVEDFFKEWYKDVEQIAPRLIKHIRLFASASDGGKRIRGSLVILGYSLVAKTYNPELLKVAAAYELFQTAILAHDDIIDNSPIRRGKPSLYNALGNNHFGVSQAICLADMGFFLSYKLIAESNFEDRLKTRALTYYSKSIIETVLGEMLDIELANDVHAVTERSVLAASRLKTAYYTFVAPLTLGAILAGAVDDEIHLLQTYGENTGIAFQLQDDIQDVFATSKTLKKQPGGDIKEGKKTLLYSKAKEKANQNQTAILDQYYGNTTIGAQEIALVRKIFEDTGARKYAENLAEEHAAIARKVISKITDEPHMQEMLEEIIEYVLKTK